MGVTVTRGGFDDQGRLTQSLSAIARAITGTRWNRPLFFGLARRQEVKQPVLRKRRRAVYARKSSEEGLEQEANALDAQREAALPDRCDDGGISGGTLERLALQRLLRDVEAGLVDVIVVCKIDRLSRSLMDFAKLVATFERHEATFVAVIQQFNTTTSMGRLTLNILLSFAQFEREVIGERMRDKVQASRQRGMRMGGCRPWAIGSSTAGCWWSRPRPPWRGGSSPAWPRPAR